MQPELPRGKGMFLADIARAVGRDRERGLFVERNNRWRFDTHSDRIPHGYVPFRLFVVLGALAGVAVAHRNRHVPDDH